MSAAKRVYVSAPIEQNRHYQCLVHVYFGVDIERAAFPHPCKEFTTQQASPILLLPDMYARRNQSHAGVTDKSSAHFLHVDPVLQAAVVEILVNKSWILITNLISINIERFVASEISLTYQNVTRTPQLLELSTNVVELIIFCNG